MHIIRPVCVCVIVCVMELVCVCVSGFAGGGGWRNGFRATCLADSHVKR